MNILIVTNMYPDKKDPNYGIFVKEQVDSIRAQGVDVDVFFINGKKNRLNYFKCIFALIKKFIHKHYDVIHAHHSYCIFPIKIAAKLCSVKSPLVMTFHEGEIHADKELKLNGIDFFNRLILSKRLKIKALNMADMVIAVEKKLISELNYKGKHITLPCGVDSDLFKPLEKSRCRKLLNLPLKKKIVFFPASPKNKQKGIEILKAAIKRLGRKDIHVITGGNILHDNMPYYMNAADAVVQLSRYEASSSVLKEALAVNTPSVFTDAGDAKKLINKNCAGYFLTDRNPDDVALNLTKAIDYNGKCNGREQIMRSNLTLKAVSKQLLKIYAGLPYGENYDNGSSLHSKSL